MMMTCAHAPTLKLCVYETAEYGAIACIRCCRWEQQEAERRCPHEPGAARAQLCICHAS